MPSILRELWATLVAAMTPAAVVMERRRLQLERRAAVERAARQRL